MSAFISCGMIYLGSILMAYNIVQSVHFSGNIRTKGDWKQERQILQFPIVLLVLFLAGYLAVALFGHPDLVIASILLGGSIFVLVMLLLMQRALDRIQENERLEAKLMAAEEASRAKTFFLSNMSHDIRTPLNAIIGYTTLAKKDGVTSEEKTAYLSKIDNAGHQLLSIVDDVLEMSRIESGKITLEPGKINLQTLASNISDLVRTQMDGKQIVFSTEYNVQNDWVLCDGDQLSRVLMNLLSNACKFTPENGKVSFSLRETGYNGDIGSYEFRIKDNGIGMSPEFVQHIFTPFERERTSTVSKIQGTGLGMAIAKNIMDRMGGRIEIFTEQGKGTEFVLSLDLPIVEHTADESAEELLHLSSETGRLLLVEDNEINMEIASLMLTHAGFEIEKAENGQIAVEKVAGSEPGYYDAVLMDVQMPVMDGYTAARAIRSLDRPELAGIPIIAMTANAFREDVLAAEEAGMNGHIAKPLDADKMIAVIRETLKR